MRPTGVGGARGQKARGLLSAGRRPSGRHALPLPEAGRRKSSLAEGPGPRRVPGSRLAMAMGGGGGGSSSGVPEPEDTVLFRRGTGQVRSQPALSPTSPLRSFPGQSAQCEAVGPHVSTSPLGSLSRKLVPRPVWAPDDFEPRPYCYSIVPWSSTSLSDCEVCGGRPGRSRETS